GRGRCLLNLPLPGGAPAVQAVACGGARPGARDGGAGLDVREDETMMGRAVQLREPVQIADLAEMRNMPLRDATLAAGYRSVLIVPLVRAQRVFGALVLNR